MASDAKLRDADELIKKANKLTKLSFFKWSTDWSSATALYEQAAMAYKLAKQLEKAKDAYVRAAEGQEKLSSPWQAAKDLEAAGAIAKELGKFDEVLELYKRASDLYNECGMPQPSADALAKGARALEEANPDEALRLYMDSCGMLEEEGKEHMAFETYRAAMSLYLKRNRQLDAATVLLRWGLAADKSKAVHSQCKAYLSAIIVYLYANDFKQAEQCYNDCSQIDAFMNNEHGSCAFDLLRAYREGDSVGIKHIVKSSSVIPHLDHTVHGQLFLVHCCLQNTLLG
ncbi:hypothetical protein KP509_11G022300 [Ceratopteris richardii]|uniref:Gamma-soluble NSF attachment protein n=1 Tax=Ceratopteris richardii TaxID=49495 RepID=A0A8T2TPT1_CERRI|nr:hypothetical protein KP509_11G022300 [Ceratopteris richardii]